MTDKLHCPFCGAELEKEMAGDIETGRLVCCTKNCPVIDQNLFPDVWELLTVGKKAQDALKACRKHISDIIAEWNRQAEDHKSSLRKMVIFACRARDEITSITKQEK